MDWKALGLSQEEYEELQEANSRRFDPLRRFGIAPSPFLKTRVLADFAEQNRSRSARRTWLLHWKRNLALVIAPLALAAVLVWNQSTRSGALEAPINQELALLVRGGNTPYGKVSSVQIELPSGVSFQADGAPELAGQNLLNMPWAPEPGESSIPVIIRSTEDGMKTVTVRYLDPNGRVIHVKPIQIRFKPEHGSERRL